MSVLFEKHVLVIGNETPQVHDIETALQKEGAYIHVTTCAETTPELLMEKHIDVIFLNHLHEDSHCNTLLDQIHHEKNTMVLPVFVLVHDNQIDIERALTMGAADYFTSNETVKSILHKVRIVLGDSVNSAENSVINIGNKVTASVANATKVLIVEDDPLLGNLLVAHFEKVSCPYRLNRTGGAVLDDIKSFKPDIVILDLMLPGVSGFDVLTTIKQSKIGKTLPVLIFSNRDSTADKERAKMLGATGFYVKAMTNLDDLSSVIHQTVAAVDG